MSKKCWHLLFKFYPDDPIVYEPFKEWNIGWVRYKTTKDELYCCSCDHVNQSELIKQGRYMSWENVIRSEGG